MSFTCSVALAHPPHPPVSPIWKQSACRPWLMRNIKWIYNQPLSYQAVVLTITAGLLAFGIYGSVNIVQRFEIIIEEERLCQEKNLSLQVWPDKDAAARELLVRMDPHTEPVLALLWASSPGFVLRVQRRFYNLSIIKPVASWGQWHMRQLINVQYKKTDKPAFSSFSGWESNFYDPVF